MDLASPRPAHPVAARWPARRALLAAGFLLACAACRMMAHPGRTTVQTQAVASRAVLRVEGRHFVAPDGRIVLLRGVNLGGGKLPPFVLLDDPALLDRVVELGFNAIRIPFIWEAYEPEPGRYDDSYLASMTGIAASAWHRGLYVIVDIHQDGFARTLTRGCGSGFPLWAVSPRARPHAPDNGCGCKTWALQMLTDPGVHRSFSEFYADTHGVRTRYLIMLERIAGSFAGIPGVVGYDLINEPWGDERKEIAPLYRDAAEALRARHPSAILFLEARGPVAAGFRTRLPDPGLNNVAFAPHYYYPPAIAREDWGGLTAAIDRAFARMEDKAIEWSAPLVLGEIGIPGDARRAGDYVSYLYDRLDAALASGLQWCIAPHWTVEHRDGWNGEDFSLLDGFGQVRPNYRPRPYPRRVAGLPLCLRFGSKVSPRGCPRLEFAWDHHPELGSTELVVPAGIFPAHAGARIEPGDATCHWDPSGTVLVCNAPRAGIVRVVVEVP